MFDPREHGDWEAAIDPDARLQQFREAFVDDSLRGLVLLSLCILAMSFWRNFMGPEALRWPLAFAMLALSTAVLTVTFLGRKRLSHRLKSRTLLFVLFFAGSAGLISFGQGAPTGSYFAMGFFIAAILYPRSGVFAMIAGTLLLMSAVAYAIISGLHVISVNLNEVTRQPAVWINLMLTMALTAGAIATAVSSFIRSVYGLLGDVHRQQVEIKGQRDQIKHLATHDNLTGLPMLSLANGRGRVAISHARRTGQKAAFMFIDLDGFKEINDRYGHDAGDSVLKEVAQRLKAAVRSADTAARIGGDEFVIILVDLAQAHFAGEVAEKILKALAVPIGYGRHQISVGASIGIAVFPDHADELDELKKSADKAMYAVKASGKNRFVFAKPRSAGDTSFGAAIELAA
jgi:diguanylate cyclase (GGDEF)-like protein